MINEKECMKKTHMIKSMIESMCVLSFYQYNCRFTLLVLNGKHESQELCQAAGAFCPGSRSVETSVLHQVRSIHVRRKVLKGEVLMPRDVP